MGSGLDPESGMRVVSSVTPWGSACAIAATEAAYRAVDELEARWRVSWYFPALCRWPPLRLLLVVLVMLASFVGASVKSFLGLAFSLCFSFSQSVIAFLGISFSINFNSIQLSPFRPRIFFVF